MNVLAIDPGPKFSAWVEYDGESVLDFGKWLNDGVLAKLTTHPRTSAHLAVEMPACYGMPVGKSVFDTCLMAGRFVQAWASTATNYNLVLRKGRWGSEPEITGADGEFPGVCMTLCRNNQAKDKNIRRAILDRFPSTGGGAVPQVGIKKQPGPLYGVSCDVWAALAVAITWWEYNA